MAGYKGYVKKCNRSFYSRQKTDLKQKGNFTLHVRIGDLLTNVLYTVVEKLAIDVRLVTGFIEEHIRATLSDEQKIAV